MRSFTTMPPAQEYDFVSLRQQLEDTVRSNSVDRDAVLSITLQTPDFSAVKSDLDQQHMFWADPRRSLTRIGSGRVSSMDIFGDNRFDALDHQFNGLCHRWTRIGHGASEQTAKAVLGFSFRPYREPPLVWKGMPSMLLYIPEVLFESDRSTASLTFSAIGAALQNPIECCDRWIARTKRMFAATGKNDAVNFEDSNPHHDETQDRWLERVSLALQEIERGGLHKVVLSRQLHVNTEQGLDRGAILARIKQNAGDGIVFAIGDTRSSLIGVSPERLVSLNDGQVLSDAVAATTQVSDSSRYDMLMEPKLVNEHRLVVNHIESTLLDCCDEVCTPHEPQTLQIHDLLHLWSPITARARPGMTLLDLAKKLHPTPAVGGLPADAARRWLDTHDAESRGWYTGALGWLSPGGDGELAVVLRCGLINGARADLFAGAGIVAGSDPRGELAETDWKFEPMLRAIRPV